MGKWTKKIILDVRNEVKTTISKREFSTNREKSDFLLQMISKYNGQETSTDRLRLFNHIMFTLIHVERFRTLSITKAEKLYDLALAILQGENINPQKGVASSLYSDLWLVMSQVYRQYGDSFRSMWLQESVRKSDNMNSGTLALSKAIRHFRLGNGAIALGHLYSALESGDLSKRQTFLAYMNIHKLHRIRGEYEKLKPVSEYLAHLDIGSSEEDDITWENLCLNIRLNGEIHDLQSVLTDKTKFENPWFIAEGHLWTFAGYNKGLIANLQAISTLERKSIVTKAKLGHLAVIVKVLHGIYHGEMDITIKKRDVENILAKVQNLLTIEQECLTWLAATRWLVRVNDYDRAQVCLAEYRTLSMRLTDGHSVDALGIAKDLQNRDWSRPEDFGLKVAG